MVESKYRETKVEIDCQAIKKNLLVEIRHTGDATQVFVVVKADAYGHGAREIARVCSKNGANGFCVATLDEGIELRESGIQEPILVLAPISQRFIEVAARHRLSITLASFEWWKKAKAESFTGKVSVHVKIDTGMGRIGFRKTAEALQCISEIEAHPHFEWEGLFTHFASADSPTDDYYKMQSERFKEVLAFIPRKPKYIHVSNTASSYWHGEHQGNMVRFGIGLYGLNPSGGDLSVGMRQWAALSLKSQLIHSKLIEAGSSIGYGSTYTAGKQEWIGTVPIGYADGWLRHLQGSHVLVDGHRCEIVGRICMDQLMIRLPHHYSEGEKVTLIGEDKGEVISIQEIADYLETIHYEVACTISPRIPRVYVGLNEALNQS
ncbi:MAG: alanine racemase [Streptococcaceae bacterium]|nr:alanine racemase [Streptococcaceae bacterium]